MVHDLTSTGASSTGGGSGGGMDGGEWRRFPIRRSPTKSVAEVVTDEIQYESSGVDPLWWISANVFRAKSSGHNTLHVILLPITRFCL